MMKAVNKNTIREISKTKSRFLSILLICAIGVGFFSGVRATCDIMKTTADDYYDEHDLFDLRVLSTFGLTEGDAKAIGEVDGVDRVYTSKYTDLALHIGELEYLTRVYSKTAEEVNSVDIFEGRAPQSDEECIVSYNILHKGIEIGDKITLEDLTDAEEFPLTRREYTVTGIYNTPMFISKTQRGSTNIGDGAIDAFMIVPEDHFTQEPFTEIYVKSDRLKSLPSYSDEYERLCEEISDKLEALGVDRSVIRYDEVVGKAEREIADGEKELEEARRDGQKELDDAKAELEDAAQQIADGEQELIDAKAEIEDGKKQLDDAEKELADARIELDDGRAELEENRTKLEDAKKELDDGEQKLADAKKELDDAKKELDDAEKELADAKKELDDAKKELDDAEKELADGKKELDDAKKELEDAKKELEDARKELDDGEKQLADGKKQLDDSLEEIEDAQWEIDRGRAELNDGWSQLNNAKADLAAAEQQYNAGVAQLAQFQQQLAALLAASVPETDARVIQLRGAIAVMQPQLEAAGVQIAQGRAGIEANEKVLRDSERQLDSAQAQVDSGMRQYNEGLAEYNEKLAEFEQGKRDYEDGVKKYEDGKVEYEKGCREYLDGAAEFEDGKKEYEDGCAKYLDGVAEFEDGKKKYEDGYADYLDGVADFEKGKKEYEDGLKEFNDGEQKLKDGEEEYNDGVKTLAEKRAEYEDGVKDYEQGIIDLEDAKKKYADGIVEYEDGVATFNKEIADAEKEIADAKEKIADVGNAEWYIFERGDNIGYSEYEDNAERIYKISLVFPIFFLLVAGLVCLTTMSRMVEEQRTQIGTLKSMGYSNGAVMRHYMVYAVTAAVVGGVVGAFGGCLLFPKVIVYAYSMMYNITDIHFLFAPDNMIISIGSMVLAIAATVAFSCAKALKESPASLMRPKAPKAGKRVLIERIGFIWNHMNFFGKVTGRNIFRYKRRMFMTVIGIAGCTALSLTGLGLKNSISDIVSLQYDEIYKYSGYLAYDEDAKPSEVGSIIASLREYNSETQETSALIKQYTLDHSGNSIACYITVAEDSETFEKFIDLHERKSREKLTLKDGAIITEKAAKLLGASKGDSIDIRVSDGVTRSVRIAGITEQYTSHYLYMSEDAYKDVFGMSPKYNMIYFDNGISRDETVQDEFSEHMLKNENVMALIMNASSLSSIHETLSIMDLVVVVLIVSAAALAFVVLYNLTNVNITERIREIATLKVLGFYDMEVSNYIFRENIILSFMGGAVGLGLGYALCMYVINTAEIDEVMFGRSIHPISYVLAFLITIAFSLIVNLIMTRVLKKISMVESLKSVE